MCGLAALYSWAVAVAVGGGGVCGVSRGWACWWCLRVGEVDW